MELNIKEKLISVLSLVWIALVFILGIFLYQNIASKMTSNLIENLDSKLKMNLNLIEHIREEYNEEFESFIERLHDNIGDSNQLFTYLNFETDVNIKVFLYNQTDNSSKKLLYYSPNIKRYKSFDLGQNFKIEEKTNRLIYQKKSYLEKFFKFSINENRYILRLVKEIKIDDFKKNLRDFNSDSMTTIEFLTPNKNCIKIWDKLCFDKKEYKRLRDKIGGLKGHFTVGEFSNKKIVVYEYSDFLNLYVLTAINYDEYISSELNIIKDLLIVFYIVGLIIAFPIFSIIIKNYLTPIEDVINGFKEILKGNFTYKLKIYKNDEIGKLANEFNIFSIKLEEDIKKRVLLEKTLEKQAKYDELTGARNRRQILEDLENIYNLSKERKLIFSIAYIDLDNLKKVNDNSGHSEGDFFILNFAELTIKQLLKNEYFGRVGGDEFIIISEEKNILNLKKTILKIRESLFNFQLNYNKNYKMDFTYGFAEYNGDKNITIDHLLDIADKDMYKNKKSKTSIIT